MKRLVDDFTYAELKDLNRALYEVKFNLCLRE